MFHSKEVKKQLEQASQIKAQSKEYVRLLHASEESIANTQVEIDQLGMSATKMDRSLTRVVDCARDTKEMQAEAETLLQDANQQMNEAVERLSEFYDEYQNVSTFVENQQQSLQQLQEQSKRYTGLSKTLADYSGKECTQVENLLSDMAKLSTFEGSISTLALQAAIDAGRLGEEGTPYIKTAEEIRSLASDFATQTEEMNGRMQKLLEEYREMDKQIHTFITLLKENNISLNKLAAEAEKQCQQESKSKAQLKEPFETVEQQLQSLQESVSNSRQKQEKIMLEMENIGSCYMEQQESTSRIEETIGNMKQMFSQIDYHNEIQ